MAITVEYKRYHLAKMNKSSKVDPGTASPNIKKVVPSRMSGEEKGGCPIEPEWEGRNCVATREHHGFPWGMVLLHTSTY